MDYQTNYRLIQAVCDVAVKYGYFGSPYETRYGDANQSVGYERVLDEVFIAVEVRQLDRRFDPREIDRVIRNVMRSTSPVNGGVA